MATAREILLETTIPIYMAELQIRGVTNGTKRS
jgi:hypothetical protein